VAKELTLIAMVNIPANTKAHSVVPVSFTVDPQLGPQNSIQIPKGKAWIVKDVYTTESPSVDCIIQFMKNDEGPILQTDPLSTLIVTNPAKPKYKPLYYEEFSKLSAKAVTLADAGTGGATVTFYIKVEEVPATSGAPGRPSGLAKIKALLKG